LEQQAGKILIAGAVEVIDRGANQAITRDVLRCAAATGATPLSVADGIVRARIIRRA
jgi:hypothetical protein